MEDANFQRAKLPPEYLDRLDFGALPAAAAADQCMRAHEQPTGMAANHVGRFKEPVHLYEP